MKPKALMLSAAVLLGSAAVAFAQTNIQPPQTPAGPTSPQSGITGQQQMNNTMHSGTGSSAAQSNDTQSGSTGMKQAQTQPPHTSKHRAMAARRVIPRTTEHDRATTALNLLENNGYRDFSDFRSAGRNFEITENQNGKSVTVLMNPDAKTVQPQN